MYHLPHICHTLVPKIRVHPEMHVFWYIDVFYVCNEQLPNLLMQRTIVCREDCRQKQVGKCADTLDKQIGPTEAAEL